MQLCVFQREQLEDSAELVVQEDVSAALVLMVTVSWSSPLTRCFAVYVLSVFPFRPTLRRRHRG